MNRLAICIKHCEVLENYTIQAQSLAEIFMSRVINSFRLAEQAKGY